MARTNTTCVQPEDYSEPPFKLYVVLTLIGGVLTGGLTLGASAFAILREALEYMLHGKLVCLGGDRCAIGVVVELEPVGFDKPFPENIDDDFSLNVLLDGMSLHAFEAVASGVEDTAAMKAVLVVAKDEPVQGELITEQPGMPEPSEAEAGFGHYQGYFTWFEGPQVGERFIIGDKQVHIPFSKSPKGRFPVPVLHAECEGSRVSTLLDVLNNVPPGLGKVCKIPVIGWLACAIVSFFLAPVVAVLLAIAWAAADEGDPDDVGAGWIEVGDHVVLNGRWTWDAGHSGWNEFHPLKTVQKIPDPGGMVSGASLRDVRDRWCNLTGEAPPKPERPGAEPQGMTPRQAETHERQQEPEHGWVLHPDVDGCAPREERDPHPQRPSTPPRPPG